MVEFLSIWCVNQFKEFNEFSEIIQKGKIGQQFVGSLIMLSKYDLMTLILFINFICGWSSETRVSEKLWWDWTSCSKFHFARIKRISQMANLILNTFQVVFTIKLHPLAIYFIFAFSHQRGFFWLVRFFEIEVSEDWFKKEKGGCVIVGEGILAWDHCKESPLPLPLST